MKKKIRVTWSPHIPSPCQLYTNTISIPKLNQAKHKLSCAECLLLFYKKLLYSCFYWCILAPACSESPVIHLIHPHHHSFDNLKMFVACVASLSVKESIHISHPAKCGVLFTIWVWIVTYVTPRLKPSWPQLHYFKKDEKEEMERQQVFWKTFLWKLCFLPKFTLFN